MCQPLFFRQTSERHLVIPTGTAIARYAALSCEPDSSIICAIDGTDEVARQSVLSREGVELFTIVYRNTATVGPEPHHTIGGSVDGTDIVIRQSIKGIIVSPCSFFKRGNVKMNLVRFSSGNLMRFAFYRVDIPRRGLTPYLVLSRFQVDKRKPTRFVAQRCVNHLAISNGLDKHRDMRGCVIGNRHKEGTDDADWILL